MRGKAKYLYSFVVFLCITFVFTGGTRLFGAAGIDWTTIKMQVKFEYLTTEDGLSQSSVLCILQDRKGFMWFGTEDGLNRFDGYQFVTFRPEPDNPYSISSNRIFCLHEDREGCIWIGTNGGGLNRYDSQTGRFVSFRRDNSKISDDTIKCICEDRQGNLWLGTDGEGINILTLEERKKQVPNFIIIKQDPGQPQGLSHNEISVIYQDHLGYIWIGTIGGGLLKMSEPARITPPFRFTHYQKKLNGQDTLFFNNVFAMAQDIYNTLWIGTQRGLFRFDRETDTFTQYASKNNDPSTLSHNNIRDVYRDRSGLLWVGTDGGGLNKVMLGDSKNGPVTFVRYQYNPQSLEGVSSNAVESIYEDRSGVLWIGCYTSGINKVVLRGVEDNTREALQFIHLKHDTDQPKKSISHNSVKTVWEDRTGSLWIGTDGGGLNKISVTDEQQHSLGYSFYNYEPNRPTSLSDNTITAFCEDRKGNIWIGTYVGGLNLLRPREQEKPDPIFIHFKHDPSDPQSLSHNFVYTIYEDRQDDLWVGTIGGGLNLYNPDKNNFTRYQSNADKDTSLSADYIMAIHQDSSYNLWIGTTYGLNNVDKQSKVVKTYLNDPEKNTSISSNFIHAIYEDKTATLWIGTDGGGLNKYLPPESGEPDPTFIRYTTKNGLPSNVILDIIEDDFGNLWLSTNKGLSRFTPSTSIFKNYDTSDGLLDNEFNDGALFKGTDGELFFGADKGLNIFRPENLKDNLYVPPIVFTDFQIFTHSVPVGPWRDGVTILKRPITETEEIELSHRYNVFSFQFAALNYISTAKNEYAYFMEGLDDNWNLVGNRRFVTYTTLPPGRYTLRVRGSNNNGIWNNTGASIRIRITPPFWQIWWFKFVVIIVALGFLLFFYRFRTLKIQKSNIQLQRNNQLLNNLLKTRKAAEEELKESELKYRTLFINIPDPILIFHQRTHHFMDCNQAALKRYGYSLEELQTMTPNDLLVQEEPAEFPLDYTSSKPLFLTHLTKKKEKIEVEMHTASIEYKKQPAYIAIFRDVSQQKQLEEELIQAQKMESIGKLAGGIAHDFNNLLTAILGHAELAMMKMKKESKAISDIQAVITSSKKASNLTSQLLAFSRKQIIKPKIIDINQIIANLDKMMQRILGEDIEMKLVTKPGLLNIKADPIQLEQILLNLMVNARDAIKDRDEPSAEKTITIETGQLIVDETKVKEQPDVKPGNYVTIAVSDTGSGMDEETKAKIFDPFFTTKKEGEGTGLGMSTVYGIVKQNLGSIYVNSVIGVGTTIKIYWPASIQEEAPEAERRASLLGKSGAETILVVEDDDNVRRFTVSALNEMGYKVHQAASGKEALNMVDKVNIVPDLMITDLIMPEINGMVLAKEFRSMFPDIKIIITSGYPNKHILNIEELEENVYFLQKPYSINILLEKIHTAISGGEKS